MTNAGVLVARAKGYPIPGPVELLSCDGGHA
jgi:hypothetical protein